MLEQLKKYWAKVGEHPFLKHLFIIVCVLLVLGVATHLLLLLGTRHSAHRTVPDLTGIPLEEALGEARRQGLEIIVNDSLYVPAYDYDAVVSVQWAFGYGLSYTCFSYSNLKVNKANFTADDELIFTVDVKIQEAVPAKKVFSFSTVPS